MTREEYLKLCAQRWDDVNKLEGVDNLYDLEKGMVDIIKALGRDLLEAQTGEVPSDRRKKKSIKQFREDSSE